MTLPFSATRSVILSALATAAICVLTACQPTQAVPKSNASIAPLSNSRPFQVEVLISGLVHPWGLAPLADGNLLITERGGDLLLFKPTDAGHYAPAQKISGVPKVRAGGQGGLLDIALDPDFESNSLVYLSWSAQDADADADAGTAVGSGQLRETRLENFTVLFQLPLKTGKSHHFGSRMAFDDQGYLYLSIGDRGERQRAQDLSDPAGSILRLNRDGSIPTDNPFTGNAEIHPAIFSFGHRNPQGLAWDPSHRELISHEHGPRGGDELNRVIAGANYGWPRITYGREYVSGRSIGEDTRAADVMDPDHVWIPSIAPSGLAVLTGGAFAGWADDLLIGSLKNQMLVRLEREGTRITTEHRYPLTEHGRIRDVRLDAEGRILLLTDSSQGELLRLSPRD